MFLIYDYRTKKNFEMTSEKLKEMIISTTKSSYEDTAVLPERHGIRPTLIEPFLKELKNGTLFKGIFLVTALARRNNDPNTRYMLIATGNKEGYSELLPRIKPQIPFFHIDCSAFKPTHEGGYLSSWFRNNMGRAFSFIDIDFIFLKADKIILIEEKTNIGVMGFGQTLSYNELLRDIFNKKSVLCVIKYSESTKKCQIQTKMMNEEPLTFPEISISDFIIKLDK